MKTASKKASKWASKTSPAKIYTAQMILKSQQRAKIAKKLGFKVADLKTICSEKECQIIDQVIRTYNVCHRSKSEIAKKFGIRKADLHELLELVPGRNA